jgi:cytidylate kinase
LQQGIDIANQSALVNMVQDTDISFDHKNGSARIYLDHVDVTEEIRTPEVTKNVSAVSEVKQVRKVLVKKQRELGRGGGVVMEGRDIGTVVFPHADVKIFMDADVRERAKRRGYEYKEKGIPAHSRELKRAIQKRDKWDSSRIHSPLRKAVDAQLLDTTRLTIEEQVTIIIEKIEKCLKRTQRKHLT